MSKDIENLVKSLFSAQQNGKNNENLEKFRKIFSTQQGKAVVDALTKDGGNALQKAIIDIQNGNTDAAKILVASVLDTKEGAEVVKQIVKAAE